MYSPDSKKDEMSISEISADVLQIQSYTSIFFTKFILDMCKSMSIHDSPSYIDLQNISNSIKYFNNDFKSDTLMTMTLQNHSQTRRRTFWSTFYPNEPTVRKYLGLPNLCLQ